MGREDAATPGRGLLCLSQALLFAAAAVTIANHLLLRLMSQVWFIRIMMPAPTRVRGEGRALLSPLTPTLATPSGVLAFGAEPWSYLVVVAASITWLAILVLLYRGRMQAAFFWWCTLFLFGAILLAAIGPRAIPLAVE
jgi:hypothetical protein